MLDTKDIDYDINKNETILAQCFVCLADYGLEKVTMRTLCEATDLPATSLYYRFGNKDKIIMYATYYGLKMVTKNIFRVAADNVTDFEGLVRVVFENVDMRKKQIKLIYQVASSPKYGEPFSAYSKTLFPIYERATEMIAESLGCPSEIIRPYVDLSMSTVREYIIWNDREHAKKQLYFIYDEIMRICNEPKED